MEKRRTAVKRRKGITLFLLALVCVLTVIFCFSGGSGNMTAKADYDNGIEISSDTVTGYFMHLNTANFVGFTNTSWMAFPNSKWGDFKAFGRHTYSLTVMIFFKDIQYKDPDSDITSSLFISKPTDVTLPGSLDHKGNVTLPPVLDINIAKTYYDYLNYIGNFERVSISMLWRNSAHVVHNEGKCEWSSITGKNCFENCVFNISSTFSISQIPADPADPDFEPGAGGGQQVNPSDKANKSLFEKFFNWLTDIFNWNISYKTFKKICVIAVAVIIVLIILYFIFRRNK